jgi:hypothetical protein
MTIKTPLNNWRFAAVVLALAFSLPAAAQINQLIFPIAELGNCTNQQACKRFCDLPDHQPVCRSFAKAHGLTPTSSKTPASTTDEKLKKILADGGPGNCAVKSADPKATCAEFCSTLANASICVQYAETHRLMPAVKIEKEDGERSVKKINATSSKAQNIPTAPPKVADCLKDQLGNAKAATLAAPDKLSPEARAKVRNCFEQGLKKYQRGGNTAVNPRPAEAPVPPVEAPRTNTTERKLQGAAVGLLQVFLPLTSFGY